MEEKTQKQKILESKNTERILWALIAITFLVSVGLSFLTQERRATDEQAAQIEQANYEMRMITVEDNSYNVLVSDTAEKRITGLSYRTELPEGVDGMLFIFDEPGPHGIWMKDMNFAIDIIWLDDEFKIVHRLDNISPDTYPETFSSPSPARYVLELPV